MHSYALQVREETLVLERKRRDMQAKHDLLVRCKTDLTQAVRRRGRKRRRIHSFSPFENAYGNLASLYAVLKSKSKARRGG